MPIVWFLRCETDKNIDLVICGIPKNGSSSSFKQVRIGHNIPITKCNILKEQVLSLSQKESNNMIKCKKNNWTTTKKK